jgi:hypothetical protein
MYANSATSETLHSECTALLCQLCGKPCAAQSSSPALSCLQATGSRRFCPPRTSPSTRRCWLPTTAGSPGVHLRCSKRGGGYCWSLSSLTTRFVRLWGGCSAVGTPSHFDARATWDVRSIVHHLLIRLSFATPSSASSVLSAALRSYTVQLRECGSSFC